MSPHAALLSLLVACAAISSLPQSASATEHADFSSTSSGGNTTVQKFQSISLISNDPDEFDFEIFDENDLDAIDPVPPPHPSNDLPPQYDFGEGIPIFPKEEKPGGQLRAYPDYFWSPPSEHQFEFRQPYIITPQELAQIRSEFMYPYNDTYEVNSRFGDWQEHITNNRPVVDKDLNFILPFFGMAYNYTWLNLHGYLSFSEEPTTPLDYPLRFPEANWPKVRDPSFIGSWYSRGLIGKRKDGEVGPRPGVYFRLERDIHGRVDEFGVKLRERVTWDIKEGMVGGDTFEPKHCIIATWRNISFYGANHVGSAKTNTFQMVIATDEVRTYAIINYLDLQWTSHTSAGGNPDSGELGTPAFIGFNAGNGTRSYQYMPYSQSSKVRDLTSMGYANGFPGRHIFRIDETIMAGVCREELYGSDLPLVFSPESGNMLGGTLVNFTGPCLTPTVTIKCRFETVEVTGVRVDRNRGFCIMPRVYATGFITLVVDIGKLDYIWKGRFFVETPMTTTKGVDFTNENLNLIRIGKLPIIWDNKNLTHDRDARVSISLWGYREKTITPEIIFIDTLIDNVPNIGSYTLDVGSFSQRENTDKLDLDVGIMMVNLTQPQAVWNTLISPTLWSRPLPLGWYFSAQLDKGLGTSWTEMKCLEWINRDLVLKNFANEVPACPCMLSQAVADKGRFAPDYDCDKDGTTDCYFHTGSMHCVRSGYPSRDGSGQKCCYNRAGYLMLSSDNMWGGYPHRAHDFGLLPWNEANKVPSLSNWYHDIIPFYQCCMWQSEQAIDCERFRIVRRVTQDCVGYEPPAIATVFGDPHFITFDGLEYTFNGRGEFVLLRANSNVHKLDVQGRFELVGENVWGRINATLLTSVAVQDNTSSIIEVRLRSEASRWRYRLDVFVDKERVYFDRPSLKLQSYPGVTVYTPRNILNQSQVIIMFQSGAGIEVIENEGYMTTRVYLPLSYANQTRGLLGNWSFDVTDDFMLPDGSWASLTNVNDLERIHKDFALKWAVDDSDNSLTGSSLFFHEFGRPSSFYQDLTFEPHYEVKPTLPINTTLKVSDIEELCNVNYQCYYDYAVTYNKDLARYTLRYHSEFTNIKKYNLKEVISCGALRTPIHSRKNTFKFDPGTELKFECDPGYMLVGSKTRTCLANGEWSAPNGETRCMTEPGYRAEQAGLFAGIATCIILVVLAVGLIIVLMLRRAQVLTQEFKATGSRRGSIVYTSHRDLAPQSSDEPATPQTRYTTSSLLKFGGRAKTKNDLAGTGSEINGDLESDSGYGFGGKGTNGSSKASRRLPPAKAVQPVTVDVSTSSEGSAPQSPGSTLAQIDGRAQPPNQPSPGIPYDGVYYTREPLPRQVAEFPPGEEAIIDPLIRKEGTLV